ncbi:hypothetical protein F7725_008488 [Dissostichus mawsoni]|uniref:SPARC related modular calcium binding 1 n=1 Tax=Dissostichus mawsoni TaxID=36200 RepID=A0A7J5Y7C8_DISMA|nr:hypothetical protein F7725_008488 [Dissostichus mawsoni]
MLTAELQKPDTERQRASSGKPVCGSDGRSYETGCELQRARCKDKTLTLAHRGRCRGKNWVKNDQLPVAPSPTSSSETRDVEVKDAGQSKCRVERNQALEQSRRPQESIFIPECNEDGTFAQVQCHTLTGYCWCVTSDGKPVSGSSAHNRTPVCSGTGGGGEPGNLWMKCQERLPALRLLIFPLPLNICLSLFPTYHHGSVTDRPPGPPHSGRKDDGSKPTPTMETHVPPEGDEITAPTLWIKQLGYKENKQNSSSSKRQEKVPSCDQERESALDEARQNPREAIFIPDCDPGVFTKRSSATSPRATAGAFWGHGPAHPWNIHQGNGGGTMGFLPELKVKGMEMMQYGFILSFLCLMQPCSAVLSSLCNRYQTPECDGTARSHVSDTEDPFLVKDLPGCPEGKKVEFITSLLDALTTDMVQAINSPAPSGGGRFVEPDPSQTLEERVVHWYFAQLDNNGSQDINKKEMKPFKRYLKKKAKPKKCARKFTDYCDLNKDRAISLSELKGCLGVSKEGEKEREQGERVKVTERGHDPDEAQRQAAAKGRGKGPNCPLRSVTGLLLDIFTVYSTCFSLKDVRRRGAHLYENLHTWAGEKHSSLFLSHLLSSSFHFFPSHVLFLFLSCLSWLCPSLVVNERRHYGAELAVELQDH